MHFTYCYWFQLAFSWLPLMGANPLLEPLEGVCPENQDFLGPEMATAPSPHQSLHSCSKMQVHKTTNILVFNGAWI
jgi:hypothetical protein